VKPVTAARGRRTEVLRHTPVNDKVPPALSDDSGSGEPLIRLAVPRDTAHARLPDGRIYAAPPGTPLGEVLRVAYGDGHAQRGPVTAAIVDGRLRELHVPLVADADVTPLTPADADGARVYRRSLAFLLITAAGELFPEAEVVVEHSAPSLAGYFCSVRGRVPFTAEELRALERRMRDIVARDEPISKSTVPIAQALALFQDRGEIDKARLVAHRRKETLVLYELRGRRDYFQGYMVPSTGVLREFALDWAVQGFLLRFPHQAAPLELIPVEPYPRLLGVFEEAAEWLRKLGIGSVGTLNDAIEEGRLPQISLVAEALHEARIARIAADIAAAGDRISVVLVAGPSSSGKTTFSKRLAVQLLANGRRPFPLGLDDYFLDRDLTPRDDLGELDYEALHALDIALFNDNLLQLMSGEPTRLPRYSFLTGRREEGATVSLDPRHVIIVEGIHGLNPALVRDLPPDSVYRVYVSLLTQLNLDRHNRVATSDVRLVRRIVRDAATRGYTAADTIRRWPSVQRGEKLHIFPYQEHGDAIFNSALVYELSVLRPAAEPLLLQVRSGRPEYLEANRLLSFLQWFRPAPIDPVPDNSILREFIGKSILENFRMWG
jgi:uridine kinase